MRPFVMLIIQQLASLLVFWYYILYINGPIAHKLYDWRYSETIEILEGEFQGGFPHTHCVVVFALLGHYLTELFKAPLESFWS